MHAKCWSGRLAMNAGMPLFQGFFFFLKQATEKISRPRARILKQFV